MRSISALNAACLRAASIWYCVSSLARIESRCAWARPRSPALQYPKGGLLRLTTAVDDGISRTMGGFQAIDYDIPEGTIAAYYPECNALIPLWHYAEVSITPAAKSVPVRTARD
jgi:hypothetical protein